jgi:hypothetical protein
MGKSKKSRKAKRALPYVRRAAEDKRVHGHMSEAAAAARRAYARISRQGGKAAEDKKLYGDLRGAATSLRQATLAIRRQPEPKHHGRKLLVVVLVAGGAAAAVKSRARSQADSEPIPQATAGA